MRQPIQAIPGVFQRSTGRVPLIRVEWACVAFAVIVAHAFLVHEWFYPSAWDATQYLHMGREIAERGMFSKVQGYEMRPWG